MREALLHELQRQALAYFLENQLDNGLVRDRQRNHGPLVNGGLCSISASGMGLVAIALASLSEYGLIAREEAERRIRVCLETSLERLPQDHGMMPHFVDSQSLTPHGPDAISTVDSSWLIAGASIAANLLQDAQLQFWADKLYQRVNWSYWQSGTRDQESGICQGLGIRDERSGSITPLIPNPSSLVPHPFLRHGKRADGQFLPYDWDRLNAETAFMYLLAIGGENGHCLPAESWDALLPYYSSVDGVRFISADLGLFVFQYSMELLDLDAYQLPGTANLQVEARVATEANHRFCRSAKDRYRTFEHFWGLSAGDGPGFGTSNDIYRCYSPVDSVDGTAHITATLASIGICPDLVLENIEAAESGVHSNLRGRYGYSNVNVDRNWVSRDVVGIDLGAAVFALDNVLHDGRVRQAFQQIPCVQRGLDRLGTRELPIPPMPPCRKAS